MSEELKIYDPEIETTQERKRRELEASITSGTLGDPISLALTAFTMWTSYALSALGRAFAPKQPPMVKGAAVGDLIVTSQQGVLITEVFGAAPADGKGGVPLTANIIWTSSARRVVVR
jgi:hypothetical protein